MDKKIERSILEEPLEPIINQDQFPNFRSKSKLYLVRCFACGGEEGRENWAPAVSDSRCAWCGWAEATHNIQMRDDYVAIQCEEMGG